MVNVNKSFVFTPPLDGGVLFSADLGTTLPADAIEELDPAFLVNDHGATGENGLGIQRTRTTQDIKRSGGATFRTVQTESDEAVVITLLEDDNDVVLKTVFGDANVEVDEATEDGQHKRVYHTSQPLPIKSWVINGIDGEKTKRYVIEKGQVTETAEVTDTHTDVTRHQITIKTYESSNGKKGENVLELRHDADARPAAALEITTTSLPNGKVGTAYSQTLSSTGGTGAKTWSVSTGTLPAGVSLNPSTGALTGTPTAAGTSNVTFRVQDAANAADTQAVSIVVAA